VTRRGRWCAFLTLADPAGFVVDDVHAIEPLERAGWRVRPVPWDLERASWSSFDAVVIRSTWDYQHQPDRFLSVLSEIDGSGVPLFNGIDLVRWNLRKSYLQELAARGIPIVPSLVVDRFRPEGVERLFDALDSREIVLKPLISANAEGTFRLREESWREQAAELTAELGGRAILAQPFVHAVPDRGELSLFYFDGTFSHAVRKTPACGDFRVQEEHGARIAAVVASVESLEAGTAVMASLPEVPLYARVDLVPANDGGGHWLMELELIEPSLYLRMDPEAPLRFAEAFTRQMERFGSSARVGCERNEQ
jgi:glutathione synthase/RimK-type ligase-like ATP-grasp enzyme